MIRALDDCRSKKSSARTEGRQGDRVETLFSILQGQSLNGASFATVEQLQQHIGAFLAAYNETAEPLAWTKKKAYQRRPNNRAVSPNTDSEYRPCPQ